MSYRILKQATNLNFYSSNALLKKTLKLNAISVRLAHYYPMKHNKHYARWMGGGVFYYPAEFNTGRFFRRWGLVLFANFIVLMGVNYWIEQRSVYASSLRPEWQANFVSDLDFNPPLWMHEIPGSIPYIRTVAIEDTWERVSKIRKKHWTDDFEYTKPWESDDGQYDGRGENYRSYL